MLIIASKNRVELFLVDQFKITDSRCLLEKVEEKG